jgi:DNA-binding winged helix-turn-helix (wHTH) protein
MRGNPTDYTHAFRRQPEGLQFPVVTFRFERFVVDCDTRQLLHEGRELHLAPKAFDLLVLLLRNRPRAMTKSELLEHLWPGVFVEETNLASLVAEIRRALGDSATKPMFLRTVHRFGYRFVGDVAESGGASAPATQAGARPCLVAMNRSIMLMEGANTIGRTPDATIPCEASGVSRLHARIVVSNGEATIEDLGSKNGTHIGRERVTSARLQDGDEIRLGRATFVYRTEPPPGPTTDTVRTETGERPHEH